jgi:WD repeat-containing protein 76
VKEFESKRIEHQRMGINKNRLNRGTKSANVIEKELSMTTTTTTEKNWKKKQVKMYATRSTRSTTAENRKKRAMKRKTDYCDEAEKKEEIATPDEPLQKKMKTVSPQGEEDLFMYGNLTAYEIEREKRLIKNRARMEALNIRELASEMMNSNNNNNAKTGPSRRGLANKKENSFKKEAVVLRRSSRKSGGEVVGGILEERRDGTIVLSDGTVVNQGEKVEEEKKKGLGEVSLIVHLSVSKQNEVKVTLDVRTIVKAESLKGDEVSDAKFIEYLSRTTAKTKISSSSATKTKTTSSQTLVKVSLKLKEDDVAKCTEKAITHVDFHPSQTEIILASGDKDGNVSLWRVDDDDEDTHGVFCFKPHSQYISHVQFGNGNGVLGLNLLSCSYDGRVMMLDCERGEFLEIFSGLKNEIEFSSMDSNSDGNILYGGDNDGMLNIIDLRTKKKLEHQCALGEKRLNTVSFNTVDCASIATSSAQKKGGGEICVWDVRSITEKANPKPLHQLMHKKSTQSAYWNPVDGKRLLTTCYDDYVRIWTPSVSSEKPTLAIKHDNQTGRWVLPFRAKWTGSDGFAIGSMKRELEIFSASTGSRQLRLVSPDLMTAIPSRVAVHQTLPIAAGSTCSGRVHVFR